MGKAFALAIAAACAVAGARAEEAPRMVVADGGKPFVDIVTPAKAKGVERYAAEELKHHMDKVFGCSFAIVTEDAIAGSAHGAHIFVGATAAAGRAGIPGRELTKDERIVKTVGGNLYLLGSDSDVRYEQIGDTGGVMKLGTLYAAYDFLETELGVYWIWPGETGEVIPKRRSLVLDRIDRGGVEPLDERFWYGATFRGGEVYGYTKMESVRHFYAEQAKFLVRHRVGKRVQRPHGHSFADWWKRFGEEHPEWFNMLSDGTRRPFSSPGLVTMCVSNPGVWKQKVADWEKFWAVHGKRKDPPEPTINCCENDSAALCMCPECRAWDAPDPRFEKSPYWNRSMDRAALDDLRRREGNYGLSEFVGDNRWSIPKDDPAFKPAASVSDRYARFYNAVQAEARKVNPRARVLGYAYENYLEAPKYAKLDPAVMLEIVPRSYYPYDKVESDFFRKGVLGWKAAGAVDFLLRPNYMLAGGNYLFDQGPLILDDFAFAYTNGMRGCGFDSLRGSWSAHALMDYALVRAFRDPLHGYGKAREEMLAAFGPARGPVADYLDAVRENTVGKSFAEIRRMSWDNFAGSQGGGSFGNGAAFIGEFFSDTFLRRQARRLDDAAAAAKGDAEALARVDFLRKGLVDTILTRKTRIAQKRWNAAKGDASLKAAFDEAFRRMNEFRASIEDECVCNFKSEAFREHAALRWPHVPISDAAPAPAKR